MSRKLREVKIHERNQKKKHLKKQTGLKKETHEEVNREATTPGKEEN